MLWLIIGQIFTSDWGHFTLTPSLGVIPCEYPDKLFSPETRVIMLPDTEDRTIATDPTLSKTQISSRFPFVWTKHRNLTDRQTDRSAVLLQRCALRAMRTRCNEKLCGPNGQQDMRHSL